jgi:hypothetical protein
MIMKRDDTGQKFGRLTAVKSLGYDARSGATWWECRCDCGNLKAVRLYHLVSGLVRSCSCLNRELSAQRATIRHGHSRRGKLTAEYMAFRSAKARCTANSKAPYWKNYGGRGIRFEFGSFEQFYACLGPRPPKHSLDRINNDGPYAPNNCRWATWSQRQKNRRTFKRAKRHGMKAEA